MNYKIYECLFRLLLFKYSSAAAPVFEELYQRLSLSVDKPDITHEKLWRPQKTINSIKVYWVKEINAKCIQHVNI